MKGGDIIFKFLKAHFFTKQFLRLGIIVTGIALTTVGAITFYGQNVGNFVMSLDDELKAVDIVISKEPEMYLGATDPDKQVTRINGPQIIDTRDITYTMVDLKNSVLTNGNYENFIDEKSQYVAVTFFLKNYGGATQVNYKMLITQALNGMEKSIRIMTVVIPDPDGIRQTISQNKDDKAIEIINNYKKIYMLSDIEGDNEHFYDTVRRPYKESPEYLNPEPYLHPFVSDKVVFEETTPIIGQNQKIQFTVYMWIEGKDPDTSTDILGGKIKIRMDFTALQSEDDKNEKQ